MQGIAHREQLNQRPLDVAKCRHLKSEAIQIIKMIFIIVGQKI